MKRKQNAIVTNIEAILREFFILGYYDCWSVYKSVGLPYFPEKAERSNFQLYYYIILQGVQDFTIHCNPSLVFKALNAMRVYSHSYWLVIFVFFYNQ